MNHPSVIYTLFPSIRKGNGSGHLLRCCDLVETIGDNAYIALPEAGSPGYFPPDRIAEMIDGRAAESRFLYTMPDVTGVSVLDRRETDPELYAELRRKGPVIVLDEGSSARDTASYVIDTLPRLEKRYKANIQSAGLLDLPDPSSETREGRGVLVTFGGEDPAGLSEILVRTLIPAFFRPDEITVLRPSLSRLPRLPGGVKLLEPVRDLKSGLVSYSLIFCSFGLTAYEAVAAGTPVILFNPSRYHRDLSRKAGLPEIGVIHPETSKLKRLLSDRERLNSLCRAVVPEDRLSLSDLIKDLRFDMFLDCPVCGSSMNPAAARFPDRTYFTCRQCGTIYQENYSGHRDDYGKSYFFEDYERQYGKTYLADFDTIRDLSRPRLEIIKSMVSSKSDKPDLLDAGCAYGPFLAEAAAYGFNPCGVDVSAGAVAYVKDTLGFPAAVSSFQDFKPEMSGNCDTFDAVTMWFVIEHFPYLEEVLDKVSGLLAPGGVFAFSTPNASGISGRRNLEAFLRNSPADHRSVFSPRSVRKILESHGMTLERIRITGHHPERFPPDKDRGLRLPDSVYGFISRLFGLGDTFEAYAVKRKDHDE